MVFVWKVRLETGGSQAERGENTILMEAVYEDPEVRLTAENIQWKCPECYGLKQVLYVGGARSGLIQCAKCGKVIWPGRSKGADTV